MSLRDTDNKANSVGINMLAPFIWPYKMLLQLHQAAYKQNLLAIKALPVPVISVGNLSAGGTGKTPVIIDLASQLLHHNVKVGILSRGYKRANSQNCTVVGDGLGNYASFDDSGDEPLMMAKMLPQAVVIVHQDRYVAGKKAVDDFNCQVLLLDDGFQHWRLKRDRDIVLLDYNSPPWSDSLLPVGRLREEPAALKRAGYVVITKVPDHFDQNKIQQFKEFITNYSPACQISLSRFEPSSIHQLINGKWTDVAIEKLKDLQVVSFCGIAKSNDFFNTIKELGAKVLSQISFVDHHNYTKQDIQLLEKQLKTTGAEYFVTTRKDLIRLENSKIAPRLLAINLDMQWVESSLDVMQILATCPGSRVSERPLYVAEKS